MKTTISTKGQLILPAEILRAARSLLAGTIDAGAFAERATAADLRLAGVERIAGERLGAVLDRWHADVLGGVETAKQGVLQQAGPDAYAVSTHPQRGRGHRARELRRSVPARSGSMYVLAGCNAARSALPTGRFRATPGPSFG